MDRKKSALLQKNVRKRGMFRDYIEKSINIPYHHEEDLCSYWAPDDLSYVKKAWAAPTHTVSDNNNVRS